MSIFDHLMSGRLRASFVYQDARCVAFMDLRPLARGHVLVVPRTGVVTLAELDASLLAHLWDVAVRVGIAQQRALGSSAQHFLVNDGRDASQSVPHVHIHVIPRYRGDGMGTVLRMMKHLVMLGRPPRETAQLRARLDEEARLIASALDVRRVPRDAASPDAGTGPEGAG